MPALLPANGTECRRVPPVGSFAAGVSCLSAMWAASHPCGAAIGQPGLANPEWRFRRSLEEVRRLSSTPAPKRHVGAQLRPRLRDTPTHRVLELRAPAHVSARLPENVQLDAAPQRVGHLQACRSVRRASQVPARSTAATFRTQPLSPDVEDQPDRKRAQYPYQPWWRRRPRPCPAEWWEMRAPA